MKNITNLLTYCGWYIFMALGGIATSVAVGYMHYKYFGFFEKPSDSLVVPMELTAAMMSGILLFGLIYCKYLPCDSSDDMRKFMNWRIQMLHFIAVIAVAIDVFL